jgi:signal transduction histidine kinase
MRAIPSEPGISDDVPWAGNPVPTRKVGEPVTTNAETDATDSSPRAETHSHDHVVQFYDSDDFLAESVRDYLLPALQGGDAVVVVATDPHRDAIEAMLVGAGINLSEAAVTSRYIARGAQDVLDGFMLEGAPDAARFERVVGDLIAKAAGRGRSVRIFGEMVAVLWSEGNVTGAIRLEELWNDLAGRHVFSLFCAYPMSGFSRAASTAAFEQVCRTHSRVLPSEAHSGLDSEDERLRAIALTEQKAKVGEHETEALRLKQRELQDAMTQLHEVGRLRSDFVAMVVHDIRSPTAVIGGFLEVLRDNWDSMSEDQIRDLLSRGIDNTKQISRLVDDVLTVARLDSGEFTYDIKPFDLTEVVYRAVGGFRTSAPHHDFEVDVPTGLPTARGDRGRQLQILTNLLSNAAKFSPVGSKVTVTAVQRGSEIVISVRDQGHGIAEDDMPKLFHRFSRLQRSRDRRVKGTGLGLYICKSLVEGQGGRIKVHSALGRGTTFTYSVPVA